MVDKDNMSIEEILAACRQMDGGESGSSTADDTTSDAAEPAASAEAAPSKPAASGKKPAEMSVEEMLAAARGEKGSAPAKEKPAAEQPAAKPAAASGKKAAEMSVEEMLAAARGEKQAPKPAPKAPAQAKAAPKPAPKGKAAAAKSPAKTGPKETGSILGGAPKADKPGPMSKAEAAARAAPKSEKKTKPTVPPMPERPAYAQPPSPAAPAGDTRRGFFAAFGGVLLGSSLAIGFASLAVTHLLWVLGLARFMFPNILIEPPTVFKVGFPADYAPGQVETKYKAQFGVWVVRYEYEGQQQIYALKTVCTHLGCTPNWLEGEQKFKCPCHGSGFYKDGINFEGPAPRPLERYAISLADDGQLEVDKSREFQEEMGQWQEPASFYAV